LTLATRTALTFGPFAFTCSIFACVAAALFDPELFRTWEPRPGGRDRTGA